MSINYSVKLSNFLYLVIVIVILRPSSSQSLEVQKMLDNQTVVIGTFIETPQSKHHVLILAESIREFGGLLSKSPIWAYMPEQILDKDPEINKKLLEFNVELKSSSAPEKSLKFYYSRKVYAAEIAEQQALNSYDLLIWLDEDTIILKEPTAFLLPDQKQIAYCPVMHQNIGSTFDEKPDAFWQRLYNKFSISEASLFPMITTTGKEKIRPYFNAGCLIVRPKNGLMKKWTEFYAMLYQDQFYIDMCEKDIKYRVFLHQAALTAAILRLYKKGDMVELPKTFNYPIFFDEMFGAPDKHDSIMDVITMRYDIYFKNPDPNWDKKLKAPEGIINWLKKRLPIRLEDDKS